MRASVEKNGFGSFRVVRGVLCCLTLLLLAGCPLESREPLGSPAGGEIDGTLLGKWRFEDKASKDIGYLTISRFNDTEMLIVTEEEGQKSPDMMRGFVTEVDGKKFLNVQEMKDKYGERKWIFVSYTTGDCSLKFRIVSDSLLPKGEKKDLNSKEILEFIRKNLGNEKMYDEETTLTCVRG